MTSATSQGASAGGAGPASGAAGAGADGADRAGQSRDLRDRTVSTPLPPVVPAVPVLTACLGVSVSLAVLCVLAVVVPAPRIAVGPLALPGGPHDPSVLVFLVLVALAGSALGVGLLRGALPRAEAAGSGAAVDRSALVVRGPGRTLVRIAGGWLLVVLLVLLPAWAGLLPLPVVGLVLPFAVATSVPALVVRRVAAASGRRRGLAVLVAGPGEAVSGALTVAGPVRAPVLPVVLTGELLAPARRPGGSSPPGGSSRAGAPGPGGESAGRARGRGPAAGEWGFQAGPPPAGASGA